MLIIKIIYGEKVKEISAKKDEGRLNYIKNNLSPVTIIEPDSYLLYINYVFSMYFLCLYNTDGAQMMHKWSTEDIMLAGGVYIARFNLNYILASARNTAWSEIVRNK